jgi:flagellar basal-body rod protein FlgC
MFARAALSAGGDTRFMDAISAIGLSGLNAASVRVQVSASNLANTDDAAPLPGSGVAGPAPFVPMRVQTVSLGQGGVQAQLSAARPGWGPAYRPDSPYADADGMAAMPDVDLASELVGQAEALQQYRASAALIAVDGRMKKAALDLLS